MPFEVEIAVMVGMVILVPAGIVLLCLAIGVLYNRFHKERKERVDPAPLLSPTLQWMNTAGSILLARNGGNFRYMAGEFDPGWERDVTAVEDTRKFLWKFWEIQSHESAREEMLDLVHSGTRRRYAWEMQQLERMYAGYSEEQLIEAAKKENPSADEDSFLPKMLMAWRRYGENALLGWDVGRCAYISQKCYLAGYLSMEELLDITVEAGRKAQAVYRNWEEMMESYLLGGQYWKREDAGNPDTMTAQRWELYERIWKGEKPYSFIPYVSIAFDTPLSKEVVTDRFGFLNTPPRRP